MTRLVLLSCVAGALFLSVGCAHNAMDGNGSVWTGEYFGDVGLRGDNNQMTIRSGSRVWKLSIIGNKSNVMVEDGATVNRVEFIGRGNVVSLPENLIVRVTEIGNNQLIRRPVERRAFADTGLLPGEVSPPAYVSPAPPPAWTPAPAPTTPMSPAPSPAPVVTTPADTEPDSAGPSPGVRETPSQGRLEPLEPVPAGSPPPSNEPPLK